MIKLIDQLVQVCMYVLLFHTQNLITFRVVDEIIRLGKESDRNEAPDSAYSMRHKVLCRIIYEQQQKREYTQKKNERKSETTSQVGHPLYVMKFR